MFCLPGAQRMTLIAVLPVTELSKCQALIRQYHDLVDGFELRWDYALDLKEEWIEHLRGLSDKIMIFTLRTKAQGGRYQGDVESQWRILQKLAKYNPDYIDLEYDAPAAWYARFRQDYPHIQLICSWHDFNAQGQNWEHIYQQVISKPWAVLKLARLFDSSLAALEWLMCMKSKNLPHPVCAIAMGDVAGFARVLGPCLGQFFDYAAVDPELTLAPGQLSVREMLETYRYRSLNSSTAWYALLGDPVEASIGHQFHNQKFEKKNAVYVKIQLKKAELQAFLHLALSLNFAGFSITMPLKQEVGRLLTVQGPVNTLTKTAQGWVGDNFDGTGALQTYQQYAQGITTAIAILGNGGTALAIRDAFTRHGYQVKILARRPKADEWFEIESRDIQGIINTIPAQAFQDAGAWIKQILTYLRPGLNVMDVVYQQKSLFYQFALQQDCHLIPGIEMFYAQAWAQQQRWRDERSIDNYIDY